ncbi:MAG: pseudouridine synthase, partial [Acidovorax sp.]
LNRWWAARLGLQRLWLHAWQITLPHPVTGAAVRLESGLPWPPAAGPGAGAVPSGPTADWQHLLADLPWELVPGAPLM